MGVPKFYRWISERYPCLSEVVREYQIPEFDNLYLDMNGIIHACSHPNDEDVHFRISEEKIFQDIFRYIEFLFRMIKPRKVFFMAVDGVAPRAKMNQQRGRRFRSAKEAETREEEARQRGETLPKEARFDSNCITPGTEFMDRLHQHLKYFVSMKLTDDEMWQSVKVVLSGHETPGEGEHKIMDFIRYEKSSPNYDPNTRHCLYGLDADLIMLGMCSHEPHFSLLREEVKYIRSKNDKRNQRDVNPETITFHLLHLSLFRDYIDHEFSQLQTTLRFQYNLENIIDDWVLMGFLVGNDFIPHIPHFHINKNSLLKLYDAYKKVMPTLDGYLNENGKLNLNRFQKYIEELTEIDIDNFNDNHADLKYFESKAGKKLFGRQLEDTSAFFDTSPSVTKTNRNDLNELISTQKLIELGDSESNEYESSDSDVMFMEEFELHKRDYYTNKLMYKHVDKNVLKEQAHEYIRAIQWNLHYYYNGCASWSWFYPHHYAPYISDVNHFSDIDLNFDIGDPFKPFEQLLAVLPAASKSLLPKAYQRLVCEPDSQLIDYYPEDFETDMNEKQQAWEAVVLIPFIDEKRLLNAVRSCSSQLTAAEVRRNKQGPHLIFTYSLQPQKVYKSPMPSILPDIERNHAKCDELAFNGYRLPEHQIYKGLCKGVKLDAFFSGFPTLRHIDHEISITKARVRVFDSASMGENMLLIIKNDQMQQNDIENIARQYLGTSVFTNWPHLVEGNVFQVSNEEFKYYLDKNKRLLVEELTDNEYKENYARIVSIERHYKERWGVVIGNTEIIIHVHPLTGRKYVHGLKGRITLTKQWSSIPMVCPLQTVVKDIAVCDQTIQQFQTVEEIYPIDSKCFVLDGPYYGAIAQVIECKEDNVRVEVYPQLEPDLREVKERAREIVGDRYMPNYVLAQRLQIHGHLLSRVTGTIFIKPTNKDQRKINIGLNLKFNHRNEYIPGYSLKIDETWYFSDKVLKLMEEYMSKFPFLFMQLTPIVDKDIFDIDDLIPGENKRQTLDKIQQWLKSLPYASEKRQKCNAEILDEFVVEAIEDVVNSHIVFCKEIKPVEQKYKPHQLFRSIHYLGYSLPDPKASYQLFDRVVNIRSGISVPLGAKGTIIGKHIDELKEVNTIYDIVFDEEFVGGTALRCTAGKGYKLSPASLINITYGLKLYGNYEQVVSSHGQPLQQKFAHNPNPQYRKRNQQYVPNSPYNNNHQFSFGQRMPHPRSPNVAFANYNHYQQQQQLNHSSNSPFHSFKESDTRQGKDNVWNDLGKHNIKLNNANLSTSPKTSGSKQVVDKDKQHVTKSVKQSDNRDMFMPDKGKHNDSAKKWNNSIKLFDSFKHILFKQCEKLFNQKPRFDVITIGPMKSKSAKLVLPDSQTFHLLLNTFPTPEEVYDKLSELALEYMNTKYNTNVNLNRTGKLVSSPSFLHSNQLAPNEPKIAASYLPRPPSVWIPPNIQRKESESEQFIPESFVEENKKLLKELQKTQQTVNTSSNKEKQTHSNKALSNTSAHNELQNPSNYGNRQQNVYRHQSPFNEQSDNRNASGSQYQQRNRPYYGLPNMAAFDNQFIPLQVARNNQTQRIQAKKSPELPTQAMQSEAVILTPETISLSSDEIETI